MLWVLGVNSTIGFSDEGAGIHTSMGNTHMFLPKSDFWTIWVLYVGLEFKHVWDVYYFL